MPAILAVLEVLVVAAQVIGGILSILAAIKGLMHLWRMIKQAK